MAHNRINWTINGDLEDSGYQFQDISYDGRRQVTNTKMFRLLFAVCVLLATIGSSGAAKKAKVADPRDCEVCVSNLEKIDKLIPADKKRDRDAIEKAIFTRCTLTGFGSDWKPNPALESPRDVKMCYLFEPIKKAISQPFSTGMPKLKVCKRLMKDNPEICEVKYRKSTTSHDPDMNLTL